MDMVTDMMSVDKCLVHTKAAYVKHRFFNFTGILPGSGEILPEISRGQSGTSFSLFIFRTGIQPYPLRFPVIFRKQRHSPHGNRRPAGLSGIGLHLDSPIVGLPAFKRIPAIRDIHCFRRFHPSRIPFVRLSG